MPEWDVYWAITVEAPDREQAAREALAIMRDPDSRATCFLTQPHGQIDPRTIDLDQEGTDARH